jgi:branched-chain amino acid transport system permease protein
VLYGLDKSFKPFTYFQLLLPIFAAAIVGGLAIRWAPSSAAS